MENGVEGEELFRWKKELEVEAEHQTNVTQCHVVVKRQTSSPDI